MLTAVLHAPLRAFRGYGTIVQPANYSTSHVGNCAAYVTSTQFFGNRSIFIRQLDYQNLYAISSIREALEKTGVLAAMNTEYKLFHDAPEQALINYLESDPTKIVVQKLKFEIDVQYKLVQYNVSLEHDATALNYYEMEGISAQSTLHEVYEHLKNSRSGAVYIYDQELNDIIGVVTWNILQSFLQKAHY